jgi:plastocyanin domain-containing protein
MNASRVIGLVLILIAGVFFLGLDGQGQDPASRGTAAVLGSDGVQRIEIAGGSYYFDPSVIVVKVNVPVEITVKKAGGHKPHKIRARSPEAGIDFSMAMKKAPRTVRFTPTKVGEYPFWCPMRFPFTKSHRAHGMTGTIRVVE